MFFDSFWACPRRKWPLWSPLRSPRAHLWHNTGDRGTAWKETCEVVRDNRDGSAAMERSLN